MARILFLIFIIFVAFPAEAQQPAADACRSEVPMARIQEEIARAASLAGGIVGVSAKHIESGRRISYNAADRFPMASVYKIPIALQLLTRVDRGEVSLADAVELKTGDLRPEAGILTAYFARPGLKISVRNLLELMLMLSDNTATDIILRLAGGPEGVTARVKNIGIADVEVHRPIVRLMADSQGYELPAAADWTPDLFERLQRSVTPESRREAARRFAADPRDTASPAGMTQLLERIYGGGLLRPESAAMLLETLERCQTGKGRIKGFLPPETPVAHKSGTLGGSTNDAGIITLPGDGGHIALTVFIKSSEKDVAQRERAIAHIARAIYDFFLFQP